MKHHNGIEKDKHVSHLARIILMVLSTAGICGMMGACGNKFPAETENTAEESEEIMAIQTWVSNGYDKIGKYASIPENAKNDAAVFMAGNETEAFQISLCTDSDAAQKLSFQMENVPDDLQITVLREYTIETNSGEFDPDPLAPQKESFSLAKGETLTFLIQCKSTEDTVAGDRNFIVYLTDQDGNRLETYPVSVHVWDFSLPQTSSCATAVGLNPKNIAQMHLVFDQDKIDRLYRAYYETLLEYKVSAYLLPYDILDDRADAYMNDPRVTSFQIPYSDDDDTIRAYYEKLSSHPEWLKKAYFYPLDEPTSVEHLDKLASITARLQKLFPECKICTPFFRDIDYSSDTDQIDFMTGKTTLWCPKSYMYLDSNIYSTAQKMKYPSFEERMEARKQAGDQVWWYVCWEPGNPYCNMFLDQKGIQHRILFWQQKYYGANGFLYWSSNFWNQTANPWEDMKTVKDLSLTVFGDGSLLYNGNEVGVDGACASLRLNAIRDGIEDFDLFTLAEERLGQDWVKEKIAEITPSLVEYTTDSALFDQIRIEVGNAVEAAGK